ncbi:unnamed protein product, partial [Phaeothamnion confervicola]
LLNPSQAPNHKAHLQTNTVAHAAEAAEKTVEFALEKMPHEAGAHVAEDAPPLSKPNFDVSGMNFIVTGGTGTLGKSIACSLSAHGAKGIILSGMAEEGKAKE